MRQASWGSGAALALVGCLASGQVPAAEGPGWRAKVHPRVLEQAADGPAEFIVFLEQQADLRPAIALRTRQERAPRVFQLLQEVSTRTQAPLIELLESRGVNYRPFWIANMIWVRGDLDAVRLMADRDSVLRIDANPSVRFEEPNVANGDDGESPNSVEWGLSKVNAEQVWALGYTGQGVVIGGQDTGYDWEHPAIIQQYRGWNGTSADHDYNWHDSIHAGGGVCGPDSPEPCDDFGHGTHTMGTMVGDDGGSNQVGMAPGATWIGCRNMNQGNGTPATYSECFEWFVAPTDLMGQNPDPSKAPHVINNSWSCPPSEGCSVNSLKTVVENTRAAGIVVVVSAGNSGSGCNSIDSPPAVYEAAFTVGATDSADNIAGFSSRGVVTEDGSNRLKPDVSAPGVSVRSSVPGGGYSFFSGTSMAGPHVAGHVGLLLSAFPELIGNVDAVEEIIRNSATPRTSTQDCGGFDGSDVPNPIYGYGRIDALDSILGDADGDGVDNLDDCAVADAGAWAPPGPASNLQVAVNNLVTGLFWSSPAATGGPGLTYDVLRSEVANGFANADCLTTNTAERVSFDVEDPEGVFYYLVRATNSCGANLGVDSGDTPRNGSVCPSPE